MWAATLRMENYKFLTAAVVTAAVVGGAILHRKLSSQSATRKRRAAQAPCCVPPNEKLAKQSEQFGRKVYSNLNTLYKFLWLQILLLIYAVSKFTDAVPQTHPDAAALIVRFLLSMIT